MTAGNELGMRTGAVLSRMDAVIGRAVGNGLEVIEALDLLKGDGPQDLMELVATLGKPFLPSATSAIAVGEALPYSPPFKIQ